MNNIPPFPTIHDNTAREPLRSPVRPSPPPTLPSAPLTQEAAGEPTEPAPVLAASAETAMNDLRAKMAQVSVEYANGRLNRAQFDALYQRYSEQRTIIERLIARDPHSSAWKQVLGAAEASGYLRDHYEAEALYYVVYRHEQPQPLASGGRQPIPALIAPALRRIWAVPGAPKQGLGRRQITDTHWLILAAGERTVTAVMFSQEPSITQARLVRDLHTDFERANTTALLRGWIMPERMVFPQRALLERNS